MTVVPTARTPAAAPVCKDGSALMRPPRPAVAEEDALAFVMASAIVLGGNRHRPGSPDGTWLGADGLADVGPQTGATARQGSEHGGRE
jgi:hypothetical protein